MGCLSVVIDFLVVMLPFIHSFIHSSSYEVTFYIVHFVNAQKLYIIKFVQEG